MAPDDTGSGGGDSPLRSILSRLWYPRVYALTALFLLGGGVGLASGTWKNLCATCPSVAQIRTWEPEQTSKLLTPEGELIVELGYEQKTPISVHSLPDHVPQAVIAVEDKRFYEHGGFDPRGLARAVFGVLTGRNLGGGSTITQQLARNMFKGEIGFARRYTRKLKELQVALELERSYSKDQILEAYLNEIYMGRGYGFQSAARGYLGKNATELNVAEAALLAAILNKPGLYNPFTRPENARSRRALVLDRMADQGYITEAEADEWKAYPLPEEDSGSRTLHGPAPYFEEWVRQILDSRFGDEVYRGGLRVYTTLDLEMQEAAREAMEWGWERIESMPNFRHEPYEAFDTVESFPSGRTPYLQGALVAVDPHTGHVKALVGGRDFDQSEFDRARQAKRQAGSSFKPFVYTAAIASGIPASHIVYDQPVVYPQVDGTEWRPSNFDPEFRGPITIREGLRRSINMIAIRLGWEEVGIETVRQTARRMGIQTEIEPFPSTTIGAVEVVPLQLVEAYAAFATLGTRVRPFPILRVEDADGEVLWEPRQERTQVLDSLVARVMVDMLQDAANRGTGANHYNPAIEGNLDPTGGGSHLRIPTAGKTGTTNDGTNTWFTGFTPNLAATVWFGMDQPQPMSRGVNQQATGGFYAAPAWGRFLDHVYHGLPGDTLDGAHGDDAVTVAPPVVASTPPTDAEAGDSVSGADRPDARADSTGLWAGGVLPVPRPWPVPIELTRREIDARTGKLWSRWCDDPEENRYTELFIPGTEPTEYCDDTDSRFFRRRVPR